MWSICKKEVAHYFGSITGYLIIGFYLIMNSLFLFILPSFNVFDFGYATLQAYFDYAPWFLLLLIPAITMRSFSDEFKYGNFELLKTLPLSALQIIIGKFLGALLISILAVAPTFIYALAIDQLSAVGGLDWGATVGSYFGLFFLAGVYTAIGVFASGLTKQSMIALLISLGIALFVFKGFEVLAGLSYFENGYGYIIRQFGLSYHYTNISRGVITTEELIYFLSIILLFLLGCQEQIQRKKSPIFIFILLFVVNVIAHTWPLQWDMTKDKRYTLHDRSAEIVSSLHQPVTIHLYLGGDLNADYKKLATATTDLLNKLSSINPALLTWKVEVPNQMYKDTALYQFYDSLSRYGLPIERVQANESQEDKRVDQLIVPGALVEVQGKAPIAIDLRSSKTYFKPYNIVKDIPEEDKEATFNAAAALLEFKFTQAVYLLNRDSIPTIAYLIGNGEPIDLSVNDLGQSIRHQYHLAVFDLQKGYPIASKIKTLLVVKPSKPFSDLDKLKLDQYVLSGGNIIWGIDKLHAEYDSLQKTEGSYVAYDRGLNLDDLFFTYGIRIQPNLVQDLNCSKLPLVVGNNPDGSPVIQRIPFPYFPFLKGNKAHPIVQNMDRVLSQFPSSIDTIKVPGIQKTILLSTDTNSRSIASPALVSLMSGTAPGELETFTKHQIPVAVLLEGKFNSLYKNRISQAYKDSLLMYTGLAFNATGVLPGKQLILSDADILTNSIDNSKGPMPMGMLPMEDYRFGNREFFTNAIAYLNEPVDILESRKKELILRLLDQEKLKTNKLLWQIILLLAPLFLLGIGQFIWAKNRSSQFVNDSI
jgi:ABC-2 type transport system permease protein